ncbi:hypothetical protein QAD02_011032 [Eretmocerus hayati]|uniref:Uncharacterized protein n=1 Tax=Eretmocerus hayati TaxID=131215 RepID=A0ACC2NVR7_9HYME|nr:hypothetical protein QAD02_011032 [Eretmocerus hayati]
MEIDPVPSSTPVVTICNSSLEIDSSNAMMMDSSFPSDVSMDTQDPPFNLNISEANSHDSYSGGNSQSSIRREVEFIKSQGHKSVDDSLAHYVALNRQLMYKKEKFKTESEEALFAQSISERIMKKAVLCGKRLTLIPPKQSRKITKRVVDDNEIDVVSIDPCNDGRKKIDNVTQSAIKQLELLTRSNRAYGRPYTTRAKPAADTMRPAVVEMIIRPAGAETMTGPAAAAAAATII